MSRSHNVSLLAFLAATALLLAPPGTAVSQAAGRPADQAATAAVAARALVAEADTLARKAVDAADSNHLSEAIRSWVSIVALQEESSLADLASRSDAAKAELQRIALRLTLEPSTEWTDKSGAQTAASSTDLGNPLSRNPAVYLFENFGSGKSPVADAPIAFEFVLGGGSLVTPVTTDAWGKANTIIARVDEPGKPVLVRAYPVFRARNRAWAFRSVSRDFSFLPPERAARIIALESFGGALSDNPGTVDAVATALKTAGVETVPFNGKLAPEAFRLALGGDIAALWSFGLGPASPYAVLVLVEGEAARQMELNGKKYNIYTVATRVTMRVVRLDGSILYSLPIEGIKGQGGTPEAAQADARRRAAEAIGPELSKRAEALRAAFDKS